MKVSISWLKDYVQIGIPAEKLAHRLTMSGLEVEKIEDVDGDKGDKVLEIEVTPNRPDCLNVIGLAREIAAVLNKPLSLPKTGKVRLPRGRPCDISILDREGCSRYIGAVIRGVKVAPSPEWLQQRLRSVGLRPINNIVDVTNFCLMETGQPLHAFDYDKLVDNKIIVRRARPGEKIRTLDGEDRTLDDSILVIADARRAVAVAGVMGGEETQVAEKTTNILLESAYFDPTLVRRGGRRLGLASDSSYRFERGVDIEMVEGGSLRAAALILELAGGAVDQHKDLYLTKRKTAAKTVAVSRKQIEALLGAEVPGSRCKTILKKLGFVVSLKNRADLAVRPPSFRGDIHQPVDIVEEVARIIGYDNLPVSLPRIKYAQIPEDPQRNFKSRVREILAGLGLNEAISYSLYGQDHPPKARLQPGKHARVLNPLTQDQAIMRPSLLPSMLALVRTNLNRQEKDLRLFEVGKVYSADAPHEQNVLGVVMTGNRDKDWRIDKPAPLDFYDIKGVLERLMENFHAENAAFEKDADSIFSPGQGTLVRQGNHTVGRAGRLHKDILKNWELKQPLEIFYAELDLDWLCGQKRPACRYKAISEYPPVVRDVSLALKSGVQYREILDIACGLGGGILKDVKFVEQYLGEKIPTGCRGLVFSLIYRSQERTLTEDEVNSAHAAILDAFTKRLGAVIR